MQAIKVPLKTRLARMTPGQMIMFAVMALIFIWFIMACMILPILNLLKTVFFENGTLSLDAFGKLLKSPRAMKALRNSFILAH